MKAIIELQAAGFAFTVQGDKISYRWTRPDPPDPEKVVPLLTELKEKKWQAREYLMMQPAHCDSCPACCDWSGYGHMRRGRYCFYYAVLKGKSAWPVPIAEAERACPKMGGCR